MQTKLQKKEMEIKKELVIALDRTGIGNVEENILDRISIAILQNFKDVNLSFLLEAINDGGLGRYGRSYRFSVQEICLWIYSKLKVNQNTTINLSDKIETI